MGAEMGAPEKSIGISLELQLPDGDGRFHRLIV